METLQNLDLSQFKDLIYETVRKAMNDALEDKEALDSKEFVTSIKDARIEYNNGKFLDLEDIDV